MTRVVDSTLHAETLSLNNGVAELGWMVTLCHEFAFSGFRLDERERWCESRRLLSLAGRNEETKEAEFLRKGPCVVDAKSLYDYLQRETTGGRDRKCSTQIQIIRQAMNAMGCEIRWVDHPAMVVDGMTKRKAKMDLMVELMKLGSLCIADEQKTIEAHRVRSAAGQWPRR